MAWNKAGSTTLESAGDTITISSMTASKFNTMLVHKIASGASTMLMTYNNDTGSVYSNRFNYNGTEGTNNGGGSGTSNTDIAYNGAQDDFVVGHTCFISGQEKLTMLWIVDPLGTGAGSAPDRQTMVIKYVPTDATDTFDRIDLNNGGVGDYAINSNLSILGSEGVESMTVQDGAIYYETDTNKEYILYDNTWTEV